LISEITNLGPDFQSVAAAPNRAGKALEEIIAHEANRGIDQIESRRRVWVPLATLDHLSTHRSHSFDLKLYRV
jgi:hypothetical protein